MTIGTMVWGPKRGYLGTICEIKTDHCGNTFAVVVWGEKVGLRYTEVANIKRLEIYTQEEN